MISAVSTLTYSGWIALPLFAIDILHLACQSLLVRLWHRVGAKKESHIVAQAISLEVGFEFWVCPVKWNLMPAPNTHIWTGKNFGDLLIPSGEQRPLEQRRAWQRDAWEARDEFFHLKEGDTKALLRFFNKWGLWHEPSGDLDEELDKAVSVQEVWQIRERFRRAVMGSITEWLTDKSVNVSPLAMFQPRSEYPHFFLKATGCGLAMHNTITLDLLRKVKFRPCARKDCLAPFKIESEHDRKYCTQYCGHLESVRKNRRDAKKAKRRKHA
jgi:hypothetical protein